MFETLLHFFGIGPVAIAPGEPLLAQIAQIAFSIMIIGDIKLRQMVASWREVNLTAFSNH